MTDKAIDWVKTLDIAQKDLSSRNILIKSYMPFILKTCVGYVKKPLIYGNDDELSIGLMAFSESIDRYDPSKGLFLSFASLVIRSRLADYYRSRKYLHHEVAYDFSAPEILNDLVHLTRMSNYFENQGLKLRQFEIMDVKEALRPFKINFKDLIGGAPKSKALKIELFKCLLEIWDQAELYEHLLRDFKLPISWIMKVYPIHKKKLERNRKYIVLLLLIHQGEFSALKQYIDSMMKEVLS